MPTPATTERTRVQLCGSLSIEIDGVARAQALRGRQVPLLLAYMVLNRGRAIGREELIGALWPEGLPRSQDAALRTLLSRLRSALGSDVLAGREEVQLRLPEPAWVDVEAAATHTDRAQAALDRDDARGAWALAQVPLNIATRGLLPGAGAAWLEPFRRDLEDVRLRALELIGRAGLGLGSRAQLPSVQRAARTLIDAEPYRESGYVLLMEAHAAEGNQAEALRVFERLRILLRDELGTSPSPTAIAAHDGLLHPGGQPAPASPDLSEDGIELPPELQARAAEPIVGREAELAALHAAWEGITRPGAGGERLLLLTGDAGIGKSRLVSEFAARVHGLGAVVLAGRCPAEALLPYQPFVEALRHYVVGIPLAQLRASAREYGAELGRLLPELRRRVPDLPAPPPGEAETERYRLFEAVVGLLADITARRPLLLVIDDLQWADRPTMLLLRHAIRARDLTSVMVLGAVRAGETPDQGFTDVLGGLRREGHARSLEVRGLQGDGVAELVRARTGAVAPASLVGALHARTEGNPFFIEELLRQLAEAGVEIDRAGQTALRQIALPQGIKELIAQRLGRLAEGRASEWLRAASVIGRDFEVALLEDVLGLEEEEFLSALEAALAAGLVVQPPTAGMLSFSHALIREAIYEEMSMPRRARMHRRVGEALAARTGEPQLAALAFHFTRAAGGDDAARAIDYARAAGAEATAMLAHEEAAEHFARALEVQERFRPGDAPLRCELLLCLGEARVRAGERPSAWGTFREAATIAAARGDAGSLARAAIAAARRYIQPPGVVDADLIALLEQALELTRTERTVTRVALLTRMCGALYYAGQPQRMQELAAEATAVAGELGSAEPRALAAAARRRAYWDPAHLRQRLSDATELLTFGQAAGDLELTLQGHAWLVLDLLEQGESQAVDAQIAAFQAGAERLRQPLYLWNAAVWRAMRALLGGRLDPAERLAGEALALGAAAETVTAPQYYAVQLLAIRREQMRMGELEGPARRLMAANPDRVAWRAALVTLLLETGREAEARSELRALAVADFAAIPRDGDWMTAITLLADAAADLNDAEAAGELRALLDPYRSANAVIGLAVVCLGSAARFLGRLAATTGDRELAAEHFERALVADRALNAPVCLAHSRLEYARLLGPDDARGRELAREALSAGESLGLERVLRRGRALLA